MELTEAMDEVRIYNRALSNAEVMQNYTAEPAAVLPMDRLSITWGEMKGE
jgi:hypothetical protein